MFALSSGLVCLAVSLIVLAVFSLLFRRKIHWMLCNVSFASIWRALFVAPLFLTVVFIWITPWSPSVVLTGRVREIGVVLLIIFLSDLFWLYYFVYLTTHKMTEAVELQAQNQLLGMENARYRELRVHMDTTRQLRHDFRQHLHVIAGLNEAKKYDKLTAYLAEYEGRLASPQPILCANAALDAIAGHYQHIAESQNTKVFWRLELPERLPIDEVDLCMMLGNLMENALHAVCALPIDAREVTVISSMISGAMLGLSVENSYVGDIVFGRNACPSRANAATASPAFRRRDGQALQRHTLCHRERRRVRGEYPAEFIRPRTHSCDNRSIPLPSFCSSARTARCAPRRDNPPVPAG